MPSARQVRANRANARHSTGPRSDTGKSRSRLNALRHGLAVPAAALPQFAAEVDALTQKIVGSGVSDPDVCAAAARVAEATIDLLRVRGARLTLLERIARFQKEADAATPASEGEPERPTRPKVLMAARVKAYQNGTHEEIRQAELAHLMAEEQYQAELTQCQKRRAQERQIQRQHASDWDQLEKLDRYERRALSRRDNAITAFDRARTKGLNPQQSASTIWQNEPNRREQPL